jgi:hypothetical protein
METSSIIKSLPMATLPCIDRKTHKVRKNVTRILQNLRSFFLLTKVNSSLSADA